MLRRHLYLLAIGFPHRLCNLPFGFRCWVLGTLGNDLAHSLEISSFCFPVSVFSAFATFRFDKRDSVGRLSVDRGAPTCFTEAAGIGGDPLFGGIGGFEDEFRR